LKKNRKNTSNIKVNPPSNSHSPQINENDLPFHIMFPLELHHLDNGEQKICWFKDEIDLKKYLIRYKLKPKEYKVQYTKQRKC
jgi:hypothetical protein